MARGRDTISQRIALEGADEVKKQLADMGDAGEKAVGQITDATQAASPRLSSLSNFSASVASGFRAIGTAVAPIGEAFSNLGNAVGNLGTALGNMIPNFRTIATLGAAGAAAGVFEMARSAATSVHQLQETAANLGLTSEQFQGLQFAAARTGVDIDKFTTGLSRFSVAVGTAAEKQRGFVAAVAGGVDVLHGGTAAVNNSVSVLRGGVAALGETTRGAVTVLRGGVAPAKATADAFKTLGIDVFDAGGAIRPTNDLLFEAADRLTKLRDPALRDKLAMDLFGRGWRDLLPVLRDGSLGLAHSEAAFRALGVGATAMEVQMSEAFNSAYNTMKVALAGMKNAVGAQLGSLFTPLFSEITTLIQQNIGSIRAWAASISATLMPVIQDLIAVLQGASRDQVTNKWIVDLRDGVVAFCTIAVPAIKAAFNTIITVLDFVAAQINAVFGTNLTGLSLGVILMLGYVSGAFAAIGAAISVVIAVLGVLGSVITAIAAACGLPALLVAAIVGAVIAAGVLIAIYWDQIVAAATAAFAAVQAAAFAFFDAIAALWNGLVAIVAAVWAAVTAAALGFFNWIAAQWNAALALVQSVWLAISSAITGSITAVTSFFTTAWQTAVQLVTDMWNGLTDWIAGKVSAIIGFLQPLWDFLKQIASLMGSVTGGTEAGFAGGGPVWGAGTATSDSIPARLSAGEFVMRTAAVRHYGARFMAAINAMRLPMPAGFSMGGLVDALASVMPAPVSLAARGPILAGAAPAGATQTLNLTILGETFRGLTAPEATAERLVRFARGRQGRSAGRKPGWYGGG